MSCANGQARVRRCSGIVSAVVAANAMWAQIGAGAFDVTTYHYNKFRTGWNRHEVVLNPASLETGSFGILASQALDSGVDTQPLIMTGLNIGGSLHDVAYVATEGNSVYAFDATSGAMLLHVNLGPTPPPSVLPAPYQVGIQSTPVIDWRLKTMYVVALTYENSSVVYRIHALDLQTLTDKMSPSVVRAADRLADGAKLNFVAWAHRQRPGLLRSNGNIYAAFGSYNDVDADVARGWLMGWNARTLKPLPTKVLTNHYATASEGCQAQVPCLLSSIWMSGFGLAGDEEGNVYFATGNSGPGEYDAAMDTSESVLKISGDLSGIKAEFTPWNNTQLDQKDLDLGSGGVMLLPDQPGRYKRLAVAGGKAGVLYLMERHTLGGHVNAAPDRVLGEYQFGACWCGPSYFRGSDGAGRIVTSGNTSVDVWRLTTSSTRPPTLALESTSGPLPSGQDSGFFTSVSSNETQPGSAIIWALLRPQSMQSGVTLVALNAADGSILYESPVGIWYNVGLNASLIPVVANGKVYIAVGHHFSILGLGADQNAKVPVDAVDLAGPPRVNGHEVFGVITGIHGNELTVRLRDGTVISVDSSMSTRNHHSAALLAGIAVGIDGTWTGAKLMRSNLIFRAKDSPLLWPSDK